MVINAAIKYFKTSDEIKLYYQHFIPEKPKALVIYVHDIDDSIGQHGAFVRYFVEHNYAVALYDQRGHGKSESGQGGAAQFGEFVNDLSCFVDFSKNCVSKTTPVFVVGHGFGGQLVLNFLVPAWDAVKTGFISHPGKINGFVTLSALLEVKPEPQDFNSRLKKYLSKFYFLKKGKNSRRLWEQITANTQIVMSLASRIRIPAFMLCGEQDVRALPDGTRKFFSSLPSFPKKIHKYDGNFDNLINNLEYEKVLSDIEGWLGVVCATDDRRTTTDETWG